MVETGAATDGDGLDDILALYQIDGTRSSGEVPFDVAAWSHFKYGDAQVASTYGEALARLVERNVVRPALLSPHSSSSVATAQNQRVTAPDTEREQFVVAVARHAGLPTAASMLAAHFTSHFRRLLLEHSYSSGIVPCSGVADVVAQTVITRYRRAPYTDDYATLSAHERRTLLAAETLEVDAEAVRGRTVLVVDDIRTTGAHEAAVRRCFPPCPTKRQKRGGGGSGPARVLFLYVARVVTGKYEVGGVGSKVAVVDPTIETRLNEAAIPTLVHLQGIIKQQRSELVITSRFIKRVLGAPQDELVQLLHALAGWCLEEADDSPLASFQRALLNAADAGGMGGLPKYEANYRLLQNRVLRSLAVHLVVTPAPPLQKGLSGLSSPLQRGLLPVELQTAPSLPC